MPEKVFLHLLILCGIWLLGITETSANEEIMESSDFLVRQKRVVNHLPGEDKPVKIINAPYVVRIRENGRSMCVGSILSLYFVITSAPCIQLNPENYVVAAGTANTIRTNENVYNVTEIRRRIDNALHTILNNNGVALLIVRSQFVFTVYCHPIRLHIGPLLVGILGKVNGWGFNFRSQNRGTNYPKALRSIEVPVMLHRNCINRYLPHLELSEKTVCTYHPQKHAGHTDFGAGLVVDGQLAGVFLWSGLVGNFDPEYPDVFASLQHPYYNQWIRSNLESINLHFENLHRN